MALLTGGVTFMTVNFGVGVGEDAADALFVCYRMDLDADTQHCKEAFDVVSFFVCLLCNPTDVPTTSSKLGLNHLSTNRDCGFIR